MNLPPFIHRGGICALIVASRLATSSKAQASLPIRHVLVVVEENHSYSQVIGNVNEAPYLNSLAGAGGTAANYYAVTHPSIGNYFTLTTGEIITNNDGYSSTVDVDNIVREILAAGLTWKEYSESLPAAGYDGGDQQKYVRHHNPCSFFSDVRDDSTQLQNLFL
jgi:phosphatidylinositol-3-phosphatase